MDVGGYSRLMGVDEVGTLRLAFADLGDKTVKTIARLFRVYALGAADIAQLPETAVAPSAPARRRVAGLRWAAVAAVPVVAAIVAAVWSFYPRDGPPTGGWPSVAVLPFVNQGGDKDQDYFSDGITDDLLTDLARFPH